MGSTGTATVMFTDVVDSTGVRTRIGDETADALRRTHDLMIRRAVGQHDGTLVKGLGDGVMATFPSAADGVAASVSVQQSIDVHNRRSSEERILVRVGLSAGDVLYEGDDCFGGPVIEAARLCAAAEGGQILAADVVRLLARSAGENRFRDRGPMELRGMDGTVAVSEIVWEPLRDLPVVAGQPGLPSLLTPQRQLGFTGRDEELDAAVDIWKTALSGERQALLLSGEPGIGKTRLAAELAALAHTQGATVLYGRCEEDLGAPYQPYAEALDYLLGASPPEALREQLGRYPEELARLAPDVATLLPELPAPLRSDAETERYRLFEAVASWLSAASEPRGLVLVLDDIHWAARPTLVLLQHVLHATTRSKLLVVGTYRDTDLSRTHPLSGLLADLRRSPGVTRIALSGLDLEGVMGLMTYAAGHELDAEAKALAVAVHEETEGNPFFVGEVLRHLRESGAIYQQDGRWVSDRSTAQIGIPEGVREVVGRRLDRLSPDANAALSVASVIGRDFSLELVARAGGLPEDGVVAGLDEATAARLVEETGVGCYRFSHALVRSTLYDELSATRRARMHATVALQVEQSFPDDVVALARHFAEANVAGDLEKAVEYSHRAGDQAMEQLAHDSAVTFYAQALDLLPVDPGADPIRRCELLLALGEARRRGGDGTYRETLLDAAALARSAGRADLLAAAALANGRGFWSMAGQVDQARIEVLQQALELCGPADTADRARVLARLAGELMFSDDRERREELSGQALEVARRVGDRLALADVLAELVPASYTPWTIDRAEDYILELLGLAATLDDPYRLAVAHLWRYVTAFFGAKDPHIGGECLQTAKGLAGELGQPTLKWLTQVWLTVQVQTEGRVTEALMLAAEAFAVGERAGQPDAWTWYAGQLATMKREVGEGGDLIEAIETELVNNPGLPAWRVALALSLWEVGRVDEVRQIVRDLVNLDTGAVRLPQDIMWLFGVTALLDLAAFTGELPVVERLYDQLLPFRHLSIHGGVSFFGRAEHHLGVAAGALGRVDDAIAHLETAVAEHERLGARLYVGLSNAELARVLLQRGAAGDAERAQAAVSVANALAAETGGVIILSRLPVPA